MLAMEQCSVPHANLLAESQSIVPSLRTEPVEAGLLEELGVAATQETFKDERL